MTARRREQATPTLARSSTLPQESSKVPHSVSQMRSAARIAISGAGDVAQHDQELVAAEAPDDVAVAAGEFQALGDQHQQLVAGGVSELVVDRLELVEVDVHDARAARVLALELALERAEDGRAVVAVGERVERRAALELLARAGAVGDVEHARDRAADLAVGAQQRAQAHQRASPGP